MFNGLNLIAGFKIAIWLNDQTVLRDYTLGMFDQRSNHLPV